MFFFLENTKCSFLKIKEAVINSPILKAHNWDLPFELVCDASNFFIEGVSGQRIDKKPFAIFMLARP